MADLFRFSAFYVNNLTNFDDGDVLLSSARLLLLERPGAGYITNAGYTLEPVHAGIQILRYLLIKIINNHSITCIIMNFYHEFV